MTTTSPVVRRRRLGLELRALREATGMTGEEAVRILGWSNSKLSRMELGRNPPSHADLGSLLDLYEVSDERRREELSQLLREAKRKGWWQIYSKVPYQTFIGLEAEAAILLTYEHVVPGLFQTEAYAYSINRETTLGGDAENLEQQVEARMTRQALLTKESPLQVRAVIDEVALLRMVGGPEVMRKQLNRLLELSELPNIIIQVIPLSVGAHLGTLLGGFTILMFDHPADPAVLYAEGNREPFPEREGDMDLHTIAFDRLRSAALNVSQTRDLMQDLARRL